jgi:hypothetical protein
MAQQYPLIPKLYGYQMQENEELRQLYILMEKWGSTLINELNTRDVQVDSRPSNKLYTITTFTNITSPQSCYIAYSASTGKFKGYVSLGAETSWQDLN